MFLEERRKSILRYLDEHERGYVNYFSAHFNVTKETIRSDLNTLAEMGLVQRCYGGAIILRRSLQANLFLKPVIVLRCCCNLLITVNHQAMSDKKEKLCRVRYVYLARSMLTLWLRLNASREAVSR
jgi:DeoR/GlpR family transcriptional regulator of sugar metabolism